MDPRFNDIFSRPENEVFNIVFFPDRIYHAEYFNATTSNRYRYYVDEVRDKLDIMALTGKVYLDGQVLANVMRMEYRAGRLLEQMRERSRLFGPAVLAKLKIDWRTPPPESSDPVIAAQRETLLKFLLGAWPDAKPDQIQGWLTLSAVMVDGKVVTAPGYLVKPGEKITLRNEILAVLQTLELDLRMHYCPWINAYQVELWSTLQPPDRVAHDPSVLAQMGFDASITSDHRAAPALAEGARIERVQASFCEGTLEYPLDEILPDPQRDDFYGRTIQVPNSPQPSSSANTVSIAAYELNFRRAWFLDSSSVPPVRYNNALIEHSVDGEANPDHKSHNIVEMRWLLQQELGTSLVYFHEVTIQPGAIEGTHQHIGSEELYYIYEGTGVVYVGPSDDPNLASAPLVEAFVFGFGPRQLREVQVKPGSVIYTKSGGIHGIRNPNLVPLRFVAFGYHTR
jgi:mannose-6-phosphate isomerase-like protein (cupin superfamily)